MNFRAVFHLVSFLPLVLGLSMLVCWLVGAYMGDPWEARRGFALSAALSMVLGSMLWTFTRGSVDLNRRDGVGIVTFGWFTATLLGAAPFMLTGVIPEFAGAWFESVSGFTTTGASVLSNLEELPRSILLWRAFSQFIGGMGILVLCVAILPLLGSGGMQIYRAETSGPSKDRLTPRIANTAKLLWGLYIGLNAANVAALKLCGMSWFDAVCHAFATIATGGFSTRSASIAAFASPAIEWVTICFMLLGGINFALHWRFIRGERSAHLRDPEFRLFAVIILISLAVISLDAGHSFYSEPDVALRGILFAISSVITSTGFGTDDYALWPGFSQSVIFVLILIGGCAGSTSGGIKVIRILVLLKQLARELKLFIQPQAIYHVKVGRQLVSSEIVSTISAFFIAYLLIFIVSGLLLSRMGVDTLPAFSGVAACMSNAGPGLGQVGPQGNYLGIPDAGLIVLSHCMLLGRLELYTMLVFLFPAFWRR